MGKLGITTDVLNQKGSPALYQDLFGNIPAAGYTGRLFVSTDTNNLYRDNGSSWVQVAGSSGGSGVTSITGTANQVIVSASTGAIVLSLPQNINSGASPIFAGITLSGLSSAGIVINNGSGVLATTTGTGFVKISGGTISYDNSTYLTTAAASAAYQPIITLTTTGASGAASLASNTLNIPAYTLAGLGGITLTALSASSPLSYNSATGAFAIQVANTSQAGYLTASDWNTFNGKQTQINGTGFVKASGTTISYDNSTYITLSALSASSPLSYNSGTGAFAIQVANTSQAGYLSQSDWNTFNSKQSTITLTTTGASGAASLASNTLNIPAYTLAGLGGITLTALSASSPLSYNSATGAFAIQVANTSQAGYLTASDWNTFNGKQTQINGTGFVKASGTTISYDNSTYAPAAALSAYLPLAGGTLTGALSGTSASFSGKITSTIGDNTTVLENITPTTGWITGVRLQNTGGLMALGIENSTGGNRAIGTTAYATFFGSYTTADLQLITNNYVRLTLNGSTGAATFASTLAVQGTTASSSYTTGALVVSGGVGIAGNLFAGNIQLNASNNMVYSSALSPAGFNYSVTTALNTPAFYYGYTGTGTATFTVPNPSLNNQFFFIKNVSGTVLTVQAFSGYDIITAAGATVSSFTLATGIGALLYSNGGTHTLQIS